MSDLPKLHIAVLMGGWANERPVSLMSGEGVAKSSGVIKKDTKPKDSCWRKDACGRDHASC